MASLLRLLLLLQKYTVKERFFSRQALDAYGGVHRPAPLAGPVLPGQRPVWVPGADDALSVLHHQYDHHACVTAVTWVLRVTWEMSPTPSTGFSDTTQGT